MDLINIKYYKLTINWMLLFKLNFKRLTKLIYNHLET